MSAARMSKKTGTSAADLKRWGKEAIATTAEAPRGGVATNYFKLTAFGVAAAFFPFNDVTIGDVFARATVAREVYDAAHAPRLNAKRAVLSVYRRTSLAGPWSGLREVGDWPVVARQPSFTGAS